jgi:hypothetical protein
MEDYITPDKVVSPKRNWSLSRVLEKGDQPDSNGQRVAIAAGRWRDDGDRDGRPVLAMRWNGHEGHKIGNPQSRGLPTWFIVPKRLEESVLVTLSKDEQKIARALLES